MIYEILKFLCCDRDDITHVHDKHLSWMEMLNKSVCITIIIVDDGLYE